MTRFKTGDWVIITLQGRAPSVMCILGKVLEAGLHIPYRNSLHIDTIWKHDPANIDETNPGYWSESSDMLQFELAGPDVPV